MLRVWAHLVGGGSLLLPYVILASFALPFGIGGAAWGWQVVALLAIVPVVLLTGALQPIRRLSIIAARELLGVGLDVPDAATPPDMPTRIRGGIWFLLHLFSGVITGAATVILLSAAVALTLRAVAPSILGTSPGWVGAIPALPALGLAIVAVPAVAAVVTGAGGLLRLCARPLLAPSPMERLALVERRAARLEERQVLARELHDSIGHALSVVTLQAAAASRLVERDPGRARSALGAIEEVTRSAAEELDHVLGVLRDDPADQPVQAEQRSVGDLERLVERARATGSPVEVSIEPGALDRLAPAAAREVHRIVQEGLTNAVRHAPGKPVEVLVRSDPTGLSIEITNDVPAEGSVVRRGGGRGIAGIKDRAEALGGVAEANQSGDRFTLRVGLPVGHPR